MRNNILSQCVLALLCLLFSVLAMADKPLYSLIDSSGQPVTPNTYAGSAQFVFFGFAHCPDVCPSSLVTMKTAYSSLDDKVKSGVQPVFITVDPARDNVEVVKHYIEKFEGFAGLTGPAVDIKKVLNTFKVFAVKQIGQQENNYDVNHTSLIYVINKKGKACESFSSDVSSQDLAKKMQSYAANGDSCIPTS